MKLKLKNKSLSRNRTFDIFSFYLFEGKQNADLITELPLGTMKAKFVEKSATYNKIGE